MHSDASTMQACRYTVDGSLRRMSAIVAALTAAAPWEVRWLGSWELLHAANLLFRWSYQPSSDGGGRDPDDMDTVRQWSVRMVADRVLWSQGDAHGVMVSTMAVRQLLQWRSYLKQEA